MSKNFKFKILRHGVYPEPGEGFLRMTTLIIPSPSSCHSEPFALVILNEVKNLLFVLRINSAKNLI